MYWFFAWCTHHLSQASSVFSPAVFCVCLHSVLLSCVLVVHALWAGGAMKTCLFILFSFSTAVLCSVVFAELRICNGETKIKVFHCSCKNESDFWSGKGYCCWIWSTLSTILKDKVEIRQAVKESTLAPQRKSFKTSNFPQLEEGMIQRVNCVRDKTGGLIHEKAEKLAKELCYETFQASSGWLEKFKVWNGIVQKVMYREGPAVSEIDCEYCRCNVLSALLRCIYT